MSQCKLLLVLKIISEEQAPIVCLFKFFLKNLPAFIQY